MNEIMIVQNLSKSYHGIKAVDHLSFTASRGEILGLLGPNGAGKSTTIKILSTVLTPDGGEVIIAGHPLQREKKQIKKLLGIVPQELAIYEEISAEKNVRFFASLYGASGARLNEQVSMALKTVGLYERRADKPRTFSGGMKRRLNIACGIAHQPDMIIMDEPTVGIDPQSRNHILASILSLKEKGAAILYSTHYMEEAAAIADRILIMNEGTAIASGTKEELCQRYENQEAYSFQVDEIGSLSKEDFSGIPNLKKIEIKGNEIRLVLDHAECTLNRLIGIITSKGCRVERMTREEASLETVFLDLTGKRLRD